MLPYIATANFPEYKGLHTFSQVQPQDYEAHCGAKLSLHDDFVQATSSVKTKVAWDVVLRLTWSQRKTAG
jgi:hypothetical protein